MEQNERRVEQVEQGRRKEAGEQKEVEQKSSPRDASGNYRNAVPNPMPLSLFSHPPPVQPVCHGLLAQKRTRPASTAMPFLLQLAQTVLIMHDMPR